MESLTQLFGFLKSPRMALVLAISSGTFLFAPFEDLGISKPKLAADYEVHLLVVLTVSIAMIVVNALYSTASLASLPFRKSARKKFVRETFFSLNLNELCVLYAMYRSGMKTIKADYSNPVMISLRQKGCLGILSGPQNILEAHHYMPDDFFSFVGSSAEDRFPDEFKNSPTFDDDVRRIVYEATYWRSW